MFLGFRDFSIFYVIEFLLNISLNVLTFLIFQKSAKNIMHFFTICYYSPEMHQKGKFCFDWAQLPYIFLPKNHTNSHQKKYFFQKRIL